MSMRDEYSINTLGMPRDLEIAVCEFALRLVASDADTFETDIPPRTPDQPDDVVAAARHLSAHSKRRRRQDEDYRATGVISARDADDWAAFVTFAAHAYDATVWSKSEGELVSLADAGSVLIVHLHPHEREALEEIAGTGRVVEKKHWRKMRRELREERRRNSD